MPSYTEARIESADLTDVQPAEYRADLVVLLLDGKPVLGIVVEAQLARDPHKRLAWPVYVAGLRARIQCPVCLLVVCTDDAVARWCAEPIELGVGSVLRPLVLGPAGVPVGADPDPEKALEIAVVAMAASVGLDPQRSLLYYDLVHTSLGEAARKALQAMDPAKYEFQSEFLRRSFAEGKAEGRAELVLKLLALKFGDLSAETRRRIVTASIDELDLWAERVLSAQRLEDVLR